MDNALKCVGCGDTGWRVNPNDGVLKPCPECDLGIAVRKAKRREVLDKLAAETQAMGGYE